MKKETLVISMLILSFFLMSVNNEEIRNDIEHFPNEDYVKVNINGRNSDGISICDSFCANKFLLTANHQGAFFTRLDSQRIFHIERSAEKVDLYKNITLDFYEENNIVILSSIFINYTKKTNGKEPLVSDLCSGPYDADVDNFSYDTNTSRLKGNYSVNYNYRISNFLTRTLRVTGEFNVVAKELKE